MSETMTENELPSPTSTSSSSDEFSLRQAENKGNYKKSNKPMMEKKRRARINSCLGQLKSLVLHAMKKDNSQYSKLEKADILELTVRHLKHVQRLQASSIAHLPDAMSKYRAGFNECAHEVVRYLTDSQGVNDEARTRILSHLASLLNPINAVTQQHNQVPILPAPVQCAQQQTYRQQQQHHHHSLGFASSPSPPPSSQQLTVDTNNNKPALLHPAFMTSAGSNLDIGHVISGSPAIYQPSMMTTASIPVSASFPYITTTGLPANSQLHLLPHAVAPGHVALILAPQNIPSLTSVGARCHNNNTEAINTKVACMSSLVDRKVQVTEGDSSRPLRNTSSGVETDPRSKMSPLTLNAAHEDKSASSSPLPATNTSVVISRDNNSNNNNNNIKNNNNKNSNNYGVGVVRATATWRPW